jgi:putative tricarboxylic transport membrane protein
MDQPTADPRIERRMNRADLITGWIFILGGLAIVYFSWTMPRLEMRGIHPATIPGLVPGLLGAALALCGAVLAAKAHRDGSGQGGWRDFFAMFGSPEAGRFAVAAALALAYSLVLVGLVPFWLATALFVVAFILVFETWLSPTPKSVTRSAVWALFQGVVVAVAVTLVFQYGFLVRLP